MFVELNNISGLNLDELPSGQNILITESDADGSFILHHLLSMYLKSKNNACVVGLLQSFTHYNNVAKKLSLSLADHKEAKHFVFVEALKHISEQIITKSSGQVTSTSDEEWIQYSVGNTHDALKGLYFHIKKSLEDIILWKTKPTILILDDISVLLSLGVPVLDIVYFVQYLRQMVCKHNGCLAILCQGNKTGDDEEGKFLCKQLKYHSNLLFQVEGLQTGYCKDVHGEIGIVRRNPADILGLNLTKYVQFKVTDKSVSFFARGMSTAAIGQ